MVEDMKNSHAGAKAGNRCDEKKRDVRHQNIVAAVAVADAIRTSLGPRGMDKMIQDAKGHTIVSNDGATILKEMSLVHPTAKMLVELSRAQDVEAGDGTTSVIVLCGAFLRAAEELLDKNMHPQVISRAFQKAATKASELLQQMATNVDTKDRETLLRVAQVSLASKVVSTSAPLLAPIAVDACLRLQKKHENKVLDLKDISIVKIPGATVDESSLVEGLVFANKKLSHHPTKAALNDSSANAEQAVAHTVEGTESLVNIPVDFPDSQYHTVLTKIPNALIGVIQFCISPPKTDMDNSIAVTSYSQMDRLLKQEKLHIAKYVKQIAKTGCNVLIIQKSILRDAVTDLALDFLAKAKIVVLKDIERDEIDRISNLLGCQPIASIDYFTTDRLATAGLVVEENLAGGHRMVKIIGLKTQHAVSVVLRASNEQLLDEAERSLHDALCVVRCLIRRPYILAGGAAAETNLRHQLLQWAVSLRGAEQKAVEAYAESLSVIACSLAENANMSPLDTVAELQADHAKGLAVHGIDARKGRIEDMVAQKVVQPLTVTESAVLLATECTNMILKIDDIIAAR